jgi:hypothetical protein
MGGWIRVLGVVAIVAVFLIAIWLGRKRRKELAAWATAKGLAFSSSKDRTFDDRYPDFGCLRHGHSRYAYNIAEGTWEARPVTCFDYHYATGSGKSRQDYHFSAILLTSDVPLKELHIRPEGIFDKVTEFFGVDDIDFESAEFSRAFHVKAPEKRWAYDVLHQRTMEFLLGMPRMSIQFSEHEVLVWENHRFKPAEFEEAIAIAEGILDRLPQYLIEQQAS